MAQNSPSAEDSAEANSLPAASAAAGHAPTHTAATMALTIGAIGVVFGDIGTSPLYAFREALKVAASDGLVREEIVGVLSLALWALIIIVTLKYVVFLMRADNDGEGGVLALLALARRGTGGSSRTVLALGAIGAALFYGDAALTPALSVLSAVEGLRTIPGLEQSFSESRVLLIAMVILIGLFAVQSRGTAAMSKLFGPVCLVWFAAMAAIGLLHIADDPTILAAFVPSHAVSFMLHHGVLGLLVLGAVFLTVTGAEALTADMGHFGAGPIRIGWLAVVFPALALNYLGQGAFALSTLAAAEASGRPFEAQDWFFMMTPEAFRMPMVILATLATIIASQAVITGAYSLSQQAIQLGLLPRMKIKQTSAGQAGQIYMPAINWLLLVAVIVLMVQFRTSSAMATAYGIAVTGTMVVTCCLAFVVVRRRWNWGLPAALAVIAPFLAIDLTFFGANALRIAEGGWAPLAMGGLILVLIWTWRRGRKVLTALEGEGMVPLPDMVRNLARRSPRIIEGTAIFLTSNNALTPHALLHNLKHNQVLHRHNYVLTVRTLQKPWADPAERLELATFSDGFARIDLRYGFMEQPAVRDDLIAAGDRIVGAKQASFFVGRNSLALGGSSRLPRWQRILFVILHRNAADPTDYFEIPPNRMIELGTQYTI